MAIDLHTSQLRDIPSALFCYRYKRNEAVPTPLNSGKYPKAIFHKRRSVHHENRGRNLKESSTAPQKSCSIILKNEVLPPKLPETTSQHPPDITKSRKDKIKSFRYFIHATGNSSSPEQKTAKNGFMIKLKNMTGKILRDECGKVDAKTGKNEGIYLVIIVARVGSFLFKL